MASKKKVLTDELMDLKLSEAEEEAPLNDSIDMESFGALLNEEDHTRVDPPSKDQTIRLVPNEPKPSLEPSGGAEEEKVSYGLPSKPPHAMDLTSGGQLKQSEYLSIAQRKINSLEEELAKLREENEELASAGETFKRLNDEYYNEIEGLKSRLQDQKKTADQELKLLKDMNKNRDKQIIDLKQQVEGYQSRIGHDFQKVRKREKDLEHRLEIAKIEEAAVVKSKDKLILDLKRQIDHISNESDNFRRKSQENYGELQKKQQVMRGVMRALRMALTKLEAGDGSDYDQEEG